MARPNKYNLHYFPLDVDCFDDHKILSIEEKYGVLGGYLTVRLMAMVYKDNGYYMEWPDNFEYTVAKRVGNGVTAEMVRDIFNHCLKIKLFDQNIFEIHKVVTSVGIQKRWKLVMDQMRRKVVVSSELWLISSEETLNSSEETNVSATFSTQKEMKGNEIKENKTIGKQSPAGSGEAIASPPSLNKDYDGLKKDKAGIVDFIRKNKPDFIEPYRDLWNIFAKEKGLPQISKISDARKRKFKTRIREEKFDFLEILKHAKYNADWVYQKNWFGFDWIIKNEENYLKVLEGNFKSGSSTPGAVVKSMVPQPKKFKDEIDYLAGRLQEGSLDFSLVLPEYYDTLVLHNALESGNLESYPGDSNDEKRRNAVISYLKIHKVNIVTSSKTGTGY